MWSDRKTATLVVAVELDGVPGTFHTPESAQENVQAMLNSMIPHYNPTVKIQPSE